MKPQKHRARRLKKKSARRIKAVTQRTIEMNMKTPADWLRMRNELRAMFQRVFDDYKVHMAVLPADEQERKQRHQIGVCVLAHLAKIGSTIKLVEAYADIPPDASVENQLIQMRAEIDAEDARAQDFGNSGNSGKEGDSGHEHTGDFV